jgi:hypothetical protein
MDASSLVALCESLPEIKQLLSCVRRLRVLVGLRGGVVRNLAMADQRGSGSYDSLYDFVDPFGDIDLVVMDDVKPAVISRVLSAEIPFADCHFWHLQTFEEAKALAEKERAVAADGLVIWVDGSEDKVRVDAIAGEVGKIIAQPMHPISRPAFRGEVSAAAIASVIKLARTQSQIEDTVRFLIDPIAQLADAMRRARERQRLPGRRSLLEAEIEMAQLFLTVPNWSQASAVQGQFREILIRSEEWAPERSALRQMLALNPSSGLRVGAALYRSWAGGRLKLEFTTAGPGETEGIGANRSRTPWTRLRVQNRNDGTCCPFTDFEEGIAVVGWRSTLPDATREDQKLSEQEYGLLGFPVRPAQTAESVLQRNRRIPMLGYVRKGTSIVMRVDPAFLKAITGGRFTSFIVGLVSVAAAEGMGVQQTNLPLKLAPEGEAASEDDEGVKKAKAAAWNKRKVILRGEPVRS